MVELEIGLAYGVVLGIMGRCRLLRLIGDLVRVAAKILLRHHGVLRVASACLAVRLLRREQLVHLLGGLLLLLLRRRIRLLHVSVLSHRAHYLLAIAGQSTRVRLRRVMHLEMVEIAGAACHRRVGHLLLLLELQEALLILLRLHNLWDLLLLHHRAAWIAWQVWQLAGGHTAVILPISLRLDLRLLQSHQL